MAGGRASGAAARLDLVTEERRMEAHELAKPTLATSMSLTGLLLVRVLVRVLVMCAA